MGLTFRKLHPLFGVEIGGADLARPVDAVAFGQIRAAFEEHSVVLLRGQQVDDAQQVAFSRRFGPLETTVSANPAGGTAVKYKRLMQRTTVAGDAPTVAQ